jgi:hypothetical protein
MQITTRDGRTYDTERDLSAAERHVLQKILNWRDLATSVEQFHDARDRALAAGWDGSGPIRPGPALEKLVAHFEAQLRRRLHPKR